MVQIHSAPVLGLLLLALGVVAVPAKSASSSKIITFEDIKNATPIVPPVTDPAQKPLTGDASDNSTVLQARPDLAGVVNDAKTTLPKLLADDKPPKGASKNARRDLFKRAKVSQRARNKLALSKLHGTYRKLVRSLPIQRKMMCRLLQLP